MDEQFQLLQISFGDHVKIDTYDESVTTYLVDELKKHHQNEHVFVESSPNGQSVISARKRDKIEFSRQFIIHLLGLAGWEPFSVHEGSGTYYFRKRTAIQI